MEDETAYPVLPLYSALGVDGCILCFWTLKWIWKFQVFFVMHKTISKINWGSWNETKLYYIDFLLLFFFKHAIYEDWACASMSSLCYLCFETWLMPSSFKSIGVNLQLVLCKNSLIFCMSQQFCEEIKCSLFCLSSVSYCKCSPFWDIHRQPYHLNSMLLVYICIFPEY